MTTNRSFYENHIRGSHGIFEMSLVSDKEDGLPYNTEVWVYGENHSDCPIDPHFHVKVNKEHEFEIKFSDIYTLDIWRNKTDKLDWDGYEDIKESLHTWFKKGNTLEPEITNLESALIEWNMHNHDNPINRKEFIVNYNEKSNTGHI